jgi:hypothetical protein
VVGWESVQPAPSRCGATDIATCGFSLNLALSQGEGIRGTRLRLDHLVRRSHPLPLCTSFGVKTFEVVRAVIDV